MANRNKRLKKAIESLEKLRKDHLEKMDEEKKKPNYNYALIAYWEGEVKNINLEKEKKEKLLKKAK